MSFYKFHNEDSKPKEEFKRFGYTFCHLAFGGPEETSVGVVFGSRSSAWYSDDSTLPVRGISKHFKKKG